MTDTLTRMLRAIDADQTERAYLDAAYAGRSPLAFLAPEAREALGGRLTHLSVGVPALLVDSITERLRVVGFDGADVWGTWNALDMPERAVLAHREALIQGTSYVWLSRLDGRLTASVESAHSMTAEADPLTGVVRRAIKRYDDGDHTYAVLIEPDRITRYVAPRNAAAASGSYQVDATFDNGLGYVPVVQFENRLRVAGEPDSEMRCVLSLTEALTKVSVDMLVASEHTARPRRYATGIELIEDEEGNVKSPIDESDRMITVEDHEAKIGQLPGADLGGYQNAANLLLREISAVSGLPQHALGIGSDNPTSADAIRASEAALTARAEARQAVFGRSWERVAAMMVSIESGRPLDVDAPQVKWADPSTRSVAQDADATVKLYSAGLLSRGAALARLGYSEDEISAIRADVRAEALDAAGTQLGGLL